MASPLFRRLLIDGGSVAIAEYSVKFAALLLTPLFTYYLSAKDFGTLSMFHFVSSVALIFFNPGLISSYMRLYFDEKDAAGRGAINWNAYLLFLGWPLLVMLCLFLASSIPGLVIFREFDVWPYGMLAILLAYMTNLNKLWIKTLIIVKEFRRLALTNFSVLFLGLAVSVVFVAVIHMGVDGRIVGIILSVGIMTVMAHTYFLQRFHRAGMRVDMQKRILYSGVKITFATWSLFVLDLSDRYMIERFIGLKDLGYYQVYYTIASIPLFLSSGIMSVWNPMFLEEATHGRREEQRHLVVIFLVFSMSVLVTSSLFQKEVIDFMVNAKFHEKRYISYWLVAGINFLVLLGLPLSFLGLEKRFTATSKAAVTAALVNVGLNLWLIPTIGIRGAAIATMIAYLAYFVILNVLARKALVALIPWSYYFLWATAPFLGIAIAIFLDAQTIHYAVRIAVKMFLTITMILGSCLFMGVRLPLRGLLR